MDLLEAAITGFPEKEAIVNLVFDKMRSVNMFFHGAFA